MYNTNNNNKGIFTNSSNQQSTNGNNVFNSSCLAASNENFTTNSSRIGPGQMNIFSNGVNSNQKSQNTINLLGNQMGNSNQIQGKFSVGTNSGVQNGGSGGVNNLVGCSNGISNGTNLFGGNNNILIHTGQSLEYEKSGIIEETLIHEAAHTSIDSYVYPSAKISGKKWIDATIADQQFISDYAKEWPLREDIAESFLPYIAVKFKSNRISKCMWDIILSANVNI